jgi:uncharacterized RDD family membrane protein YckC
VAVPFSPDAAQVLGDSFYAARARHASVFKLNSLLAGDNPEFEFSLEYDFDWKVRISLVDGESIRLIGLEDVKDGKTRVREAVLQRSARPGPDAPTSITVRELETAIEIPAPAVIAACVHNGDLYFLHAERNDKTVHILVRKAQWEWEQAGNLPEMLYEFSCAAAAGTVHIVGTPVEQGSAGDWRLVRYEIDADGSIRGPWEIEHGLTNYLGRPRAVSEVSLTGRDDTLYLACRLGSVIATSVMKGAAWSSFVTVSQVPYGARVILWVWFGGVLALCTGLVVTGYRLYLAKSSRMKPVPPPTGRIALPAGLARRGLAFGIDFFAAYAILQAVATPLWTAMGNRSTLEIANIHHPLIINLIFLTYFAVPEAIWGQTLGKALMGIVVKRDDGRRVGVWPAFLRNLFKLLWFVNFLGLLWPFLLIETIVLVTTKRLQRIGDIVAGTLVCRRDNKGR